MSVVRERGVSPVIPANNLKMDSPEEGIHFYYMQALYASISAVTF